MTAPQAYIIYFYRTCHLCAKKYQSQWKFDEVLTKTILLGFLGTRCISTVCLSFYLVKCTVSCNLLNGGVNIVLLRVFWLVKFDRLLTIVSTLIQCFTTYAIIILFMIVTMIMTTVTTVIYIIFQF